MTKLVRYVTNDHESPNKDKRDIFLLMYSLNSTTA